MNNSNSSNNNNNNKHVLLSIVGHTNTGKTSLVRTLLRDSSFGEVANISGTTRHVEAAKITSNTGFCIELRDTPGLEDSSALYESVSALSSGLANGRNGLVEFVDTPEYAMEFEQEVKVLRQALACDAILYVVDSREPVLEKYLFELKCLSLAARPIIPVLNFIGGDESQQQTWRSTLANLGLHALVEFDTVAFDFEAEKRLYAKLQTVMEPQHKNLDDFIAERAQQWQLIKTACIDITVRMLVQVASTVMAVPKGQPVEVLSNALQENIREQEQKCLAELLMLLQFSDTDAKLIHLPVKNGHWNADLFAPETLKIFGVDTASAAATGAVVGVGVDLVFAGMSLGAATLLGATVGAGLSATKKFGRSFLGKLKGEQNICLDESTLTLLIARQVLLLKTLFQRGHAAQSAIIIDLSSSKEEKKQTAKIAGRLQLLQNTLASKNKELLAAIQREVAKWFVDRIDEP
ncbi:MAG: GTPase/DUF3482 domain-containing protein [Cellvibrionaceae bacterium]|nr:GTPase/DUF3482 domain-containing protein [Cellvibrionaceae bacterium]